MKIMQEIKNPDTDWLSVFGTLPGSFILLLPDTPVFTIKAVSNDYLSSVFMKRVDIINKGFFEILAGGDVNGEARKMMGDSLNHVIRHKDTDIIEEQIFHIYNTLTAQFEDHFWRVCNKPVFDRQGQLHFIIQQIEDRTHKITIDSREQEENIRRLQQSEHQVRAIIDSAPFPIGVYVGKEMRIQFANKSIIEVFGKGPDVIGKNYPELLPELSHQEIFDQLDYVYTTGKAFHKRNQKVDIVVNDRLQSFYFNYSFTPLYDADGQVYGVMNTAAEITDLILAKQQVEQSERNFRSMILQSPVAMCILLGPDHVIDIANEKMIQLWGKPKDEVLGKPVFEALPDARNQGLESLLSDVFNNSVTHQFDQRPVELYRNGKIEVTYQNFVYQPYRDGRGKVIGVLAVSIEVTEQVKFQRHLKQNEEVLQKRVEERTRELENQRNLLNNILVNSSNGISVSEMIRDEEGRVIDAFTILANDAAIGFTGLSKEIYLSSTAKQIDPTIMESDYGKTCLKTLETGAPSVIQYFLQITGRWLELSISKMDDNHLIHIFTDITPVKNAQLQLEQLVNDLKRSNTYLQEFAYAASHDMKEPIRKMHFFANRLKDELGPMLNERQQTLFTKMENATDRMGTLIDDLLTYSHVTKTAVLEDEVDLNGVLKGVLIDLELQIQEKNARIISENLPVVRGNKRQLLQLFLNLLNNAVKYSKKLEQPEIRVSYQLVRGEDLIQSHGHAKNEQYHFITVKDNGIGFDPNEADHIFNLFTRLHGNSEFKGTGIGLSIAKKVVENHHGFIWAESEPEKGSSFNILLPTEMR